MDVAILYYTANRENEDFEKKIIATIMANKGDLPVVSVSQKPLDFGINICVGIQDQCYHNEFKQIQIGLRKVETPYVLVAESDTLYPPSYFNFRPDELGHAYRYQNVWVHFTQFHGRPKFWFKYNSDCAQVVDREMWLKRINETIGERPEWVSKENGEVPMMQHRADGRYMWNGDPVITFKTVNALRSSTTTKAGTSPRYWLPYWGWAKKLRDRYTS